MSQTKEQKEAFDRLSAEYAATVFGGDVETILRTGKIEIPSKDFNVSQEETDTTGFIESDFAQPHKG